MKSNEFMDLWFKELGGIGTSTSNGAELFFSFAWIVVA